MKKKSNSTLQRLTKAELIEELRITEMNIESIEALYHQQIENVKDWEPVRHGHWIDMGDFEKCSCCHGTHLKEFQSFYGKVTWIKTPYCPNCGARMDEVEE